MNDEIRTIYGKARYSFLSEPDAGFSQGGPGEYKVTLEVSTPEAQKHCEAIQKVISKEVAEAHKKAPNQTSPLKRAGLQYKDEGKIFTFKLHSKYKPKIWDRNQKEIGADVSIWKESTMWVNYKLQGYNKSIGLGCTLYIQNVQIDNLVQGTGGSNGACPYPKREGSALPGPEEKVVC